ncbi:MAG: epoxide hydrolase family protein [Sporichthyaceae bacterium]
MIAISPFTVAVPEADLVDLRERLARTRWPDTQTVGDWSQGIPLDYVREVCQYWATGYDWRRAEKRLNAFTQVLVPIDGLDIHAIHVRSAEPDAKPLIMTHGWPGSVLEFLDVIGPLSDPRSHGGDPADACHVVCPSLPGYGFSGRPGTPGWGVPKVAAAWVELMAALGYPRFVAQGGDWGAIIATAMGAEAHAHAVEGIHLNFAIADPAAAMAFGEMTEHELAGLGKMGEYAASGNGYSQQQMTRPQTLGYGLADSPAGQCAWILEKFQAWSGVEHPEQAFTRDQLLDNISLYWLTNTATSSARLYWESIATVFTDFSAVPAPTAYACFPDDIFTLSERWVRTRFVNLRYYDVPNTGGHFAAMQEPALFVDQVRAGIRALR